MRLAKVWLHRSSITFQQFHSLLTFQFTVRRLSAEIHVSNHDITLSVCSNDERLNSHILVTLVLLMSSQHTTRDKLCCNESRTSRDHTTTLLHCTTNHYTLHSDPLIIPLPAASDIPASSQQYRPRPSRVPAVAAATHLFGYSRRGADCCGERLCAATCQHSATAATIRVAFSSTSTSRLSTSQLTRLPLVSQLSASRFITCPHRQLRMLHV